MKVRNYLLPLFFFMGLISMAQVVRAEVFVRPGVLMDDSVILFRFMPGRLVFASPFKDNDRAIVAARREQLRLDSLKRTETVRQLPPADSVPPAPLPERVYEPTPWYIKSNLLYDAVLMPSLEVEYRFNERWSAAIEGNMAWWHNNGKHKYYQLATIVPEVRWWFLPQGARKGHYLGLLGGAGWYDLENGGRGYRGEGGLIGVSYGYLFPVGRYFAFEAGIALGYAHLKYAEYLPIDGHYVYQQTDRTHYFGPLKLKFALVWNIGRWAEKGGRR